MTPAWYIVRSKHPAARAVNLLHLPYLALHLSYIPIGAALFPGEIDYAVLGWMVLAFALGMGVAAHCFDLLQGDPLALGISKLTLWLAGTLSLCAAGTIGILLWGSGAVPATMGIFVLAGVLMAWGYGLEVPGFHGDVQFGLFWSMFPFLVGYFSQGSVWAWHLIPAVFFVYATAIVQRELSTRARFIRRKIATVEGHYTLIDETAAELTAEWMIGPLERALAGLAVALPLLAIGLLLWR